MAAITFNATHQQQHVREQLKTVLAVLHEMLDAFVSNRMQRAAARRPGMPVRGSSRDLRRNR
jgi:hypothetical protein